MVSDPLDASWSVDVDDGETVDAAYDPDVASWVGCPPLADLVGVGGGYVVFFSGAV